MLARNHWVRRSEQLDPVRDNHEISLHVSAYDFAWDNLQALSFALFRTYAVPSIGGLLDRTEQFTTSVQKRYDDTGILLEEVQRHGLASARGRSAVRRINQMHAMYDISNDDFRYVLATFVVIPKRWIDDYERDHFAFDPGGRRVADSTLDLMTTFPPNSYAPAWVVKRFAYSLMDEPLLRAFHYPVPGTVERALFLGAMKIRARTLRLFPARSKPKWVSQFGYFRTYPAGYEIDDLGTFPGGAACPVRTRATGPGEAVS